MRILVTRPREDGETTAKLLRALGHDALLAPLMEIRFRDGPPLSLDGVQAILATSANGVRALARRTVRRGVPVFAVGRQTAEAARVAGFASVRSADGDGADLARAAVAWAKPEIGVLLHAAGADTKGDLAGALSAQGFAVHSEVLYEAVAATALPAEVEQALQSGQVDAVLLYSPRGAASFARLAVATAGLAAVCISRAAAEALGDKAFRRILVAEKPNQDALLACLTQLL